MSNQFYIVTAEGVKNGPYDIVSMVKKIRNGNLTAETLVALDDKDAKPAQEWPELNTFLTEQEESTSQAEDASHVKTVPFGTRLRSGWMFLQNNQLSSIFSGSYVFFILLTAGLVGLLLPKALHVLMYCVTFITAQYFFTGYIYSVLRMVRGQPVDFSYVREKMSPLKKPLLITSVFMSFFLILGFLLMTSGGEIASTVGLILVALPGFYTLSLFIFAPLLILDRGMDFWEALELSRKTVQKSGLENTGIIFALLIINFLAGLAFLIPMIVSLPITIAAISEMYDEYFA